MSVLPVGIPILLVRSGWYASDMPIIHDTTICCCLIPVNFHCMSLLVKLSHDFVL